MLPRQFSIILTFTTLSLIAKAQNGDYSLFRSFTVADGLPSNHIYTCVEDNKGFLWVATDAGIARFDGKHFQTFNTRDGLPDDDVLDVVKETNGRIWINCFKQSPAYFDEVKNRFINAKQDTSLAKVSGTGTIYLTALSGGGVMYWNQNGSYYINNGQTTHVLYERPGLWAGLAVQNKNNNDFILYGSDRVTAQFFIYKDEKLLDSISLRNWGNPNEMTFTSHDNKFYMSKIGSPTYFIFSDFQTSPFRCKTDTVAISEPIAWRGFTPQYFYVTSKKSSLFVFDKQTLERKFILGGNYSPNSLYNDSKKNIWISTVDKGLLLYKRRYIEQFAIPDNFTNTHFLSLARKPNGTLLAGNFYGQVVETDGKYFIVHSLPIANATNWQRKIIVLQNKIFSISEGGAFSDFTKAVLNINGKPLSVKTGAVLNDSLIILGVYGGLGKLNAVTGAYITLSALRKRTTCISIAPGNIIYHGSTDGLYRYDYNNNRDTPLVKNHPLLSERISALCTSPDNYTWVGTASNGLLAMQNDTVRKVFAADGGIISDNIKCIVSGRKGEIWVGTNSGISIIRYKNSPDDFTYQNLTINDGLSSNIINEMVFSNDTIYCATANGICAIPAGISLPQFDIPVQLTGVFINNRDTLISNAYRLAYDKNNIELHFAGIELGGHFNYFQYRVNGGKWLNLDANTLNLQLNSGKYEIEIRAVDVNGIAGSKPLLVSFTIATPFWKSLWLWLIVMFLTGALVVLALRKREMAKRETAMQAMLNQKKITELELQALKSQINPHFIFNCLNSIKLLNHLQKHAEAEKYLDRFAALLRSALEQSSLQHITLQQEIDFIENYLALEKLRLPDKLSYTIDAGSSLNTAALLIPSMLLQPYVENAVKHGIAPLKNKQGLVQVRFYVKDNCLMAEVEDNGVGMQTTAGLTGSTGIGNRNTGRRSSLYSITTTVTDLKMKDVNLSGTLVQLKIPISKNELTYDQSNPGR